MVRKKTHGEYRESVQSKRERAKLRENRRDRRGVVFVRDFSLSIIKLRPISNSHRKEYSNENNILHFLKYFIILFTLGTAHLPQVQFPEHTSIEHVLFVE